MASTGPSSSGGSGPTTTAANSAAAANGPDTHTIIRAAAAPLIMANMSPTQRQEAAATNSNNYEPLDKTTSNTLKRNPKMEMCKTDLLKLLGYLEGELQARDIVIATLKSEKLKQLLNSRYRSGTSDPHSALSRDTAITCGSSGSQNNHMEQLATTLENLVGRQRYLKSHMANLLKHSELRHRNVVRELEEERRKNQPIAALGDGSDSALEKERLRLMKELELERQEKKRLEGEVKVANDVLQEEKNRHKQIVLVLLAERKKIIMKYIEERKRSEDLAQILSEEKVRVNSMAESLEEETKKATLMEAEMEKQAVSYDIERSQYRQSTASKEKKFNELQAENEKLRAEIEQLREQLVKRGGVGVTPPPPPAKPANLAAMPGLRATAANAVASVKGAVLGAGTPMVSSKVVQPTATVSSVPVSGPTTGIARSVQPGQALRGAAAFVAASSIESAASQDSTAAQGLKRPVVPGAAGSTGTVIAVKKVGGVALAAGAAAAAALARGTPPPVPPNKPIVPPKKDAAFLRRAESSAAAIGETAAAATTTTPVKPQFVKQNTVIANPAAAAANPVVPPVAAAVATPAPVVDDEAKTR
ncbi:hypothetical protein TKK_0019505 [Trichogramma kaykai]|uniref:Cortactin-binding protein-2 N-terminal domain-containing protein n=1 Tax=Trichogramma kaykai TaxID=54128 RepID=A0ABD2VSU3_9HYME